MEITDIRIRKVVGGGNLMAYVTVTFNECFMVHNIRIVNGRKGFFIIMPSRKTSLGEHKDIVHPLNAEFRDVLQKKILGKYYLCDEPDDVIYFRETGQKDAG